MRITLGRQDSADASRPLINLSDDTDASTLSLTSQQNNESDTSRQVTRNSSNASKLSRPMAVIHINDSDSVDGRPRKPPTMPQQPDQKLTSPIGAIHKSIENQLNEKAAQRSAKEVETSSRRTASLRDADTLEDRLRLKRDSGSDSRPGSVRPLRKTVSQRQVKNNSSYGNKFTKAFTRKSGFNFLFDEATGGVRSGSRDSDSSSDIESDLQKFESLYRRVHKRLKKRSRQEDEPVEITTTSDSYMSPESEDDKNITCREAFAGRRVRKWAFWFIVAFLAALTIKDVIELVTEYSENPKQSVINIVFNDSMTMPNITFCVGKNQAYSHFNLTVDDNWDSIVDDHLARLGDRESFLGESWDYRMTVEGYEVISSLSSMERETESIHGTVHAITKFRKLPRLEGKRKMIKKWIEVIERRGVSFDQFTQKVGDETIRPSMRRFQRLTFNEEQNISTRFHTSWISENQFCFQPWSHDPHYTTVSDQGRFFTMGLSHNGENLSNKSINCMTVDFHGRPSSLNRFMEGNGRTRDGFTDELCPGLYHEVAVEVKALYEMLENDENGTICREQKPDGDNEFDCKSRCRMEMLRKWCGCTPLTLSYLMKNPDEEIKKFALCDYTKCFLDIQNRNYTDLECQSNCHRDCRQIRYTINHKTQGRLLRPDMTVLELQWGSFEYLRMEQNFVWSVTTFIAALGGSIGMWLGLSILSLIQGSSYAYSYVRNTVIKKKITRKRSSIVPVSSTQTEDELAADPFGENPIKPRV